jgi:hypothetical protein
MKRGRKPIHGKAMTGAERQARHQAKKTAAYLAANPLPEWMAGALTMRELAAGALKLDNVLADIDDPRLRAELLAQAAEDEAAQEAEGDEEELLTRLAG